MEIKVESKNKRYVNLLKECLNENCSDIITFLLFEYEYALFFKKDYSFSLNVKKISNDSFLHFEIIEKLIALLGGIPHFNLNKEFYQYLLTDKNTLLELNIRLTKKKIILYTEKLGVIDDIYIKEIFKRFIIEERKNLKILELLHLENKVNKS